jgi:hypothetical protein
MTTVRPATAAGSPDAPRFWTTVAGVTGPGPGMT